MRTLIRNIATVADQLGGAHEDEAVDERVVAMQQFRIGGHDGAVVAMVHLGRIVVAAGTQFIEHLTQQHGYQPRHFRARPAGPAVPPFSGVGRPLPQVGESGEIPP